VQVVAERFVGKIRPVSPQKAQQYDNEGKDQPEMGVSVFVHEFVSDTSVLAGIF
jgi:hypothetical protein